MVLAAARVRHARRGIAPVTAAVLIAAAPARADPAAAGDPPAPRLASLAWVRAPGAESCIGPVALSQAVAQKLGRDAIAAPSRSSLAIEGHIERVDGAWRATLAVVTEAGEVQGLRELRSEAPDCRALDEAIALVMALLIEPGAALGPAHGAPPPPAPATPRPAPAAPPAAPSPPVVTTPSVPPPPVEPWRIESAVGLVVGVGLLPGEAATGVRGDVRITPPGWPAIEIGGAYWPSRPGGTGTVGANFSLGWGSLSLCPTLLEGDGNGLRICFGSVLGALVADTTGLSPPAHKDQLVFYPDLALRYQRLLVGPLTVSAGAGVLIPTERPTFYYLDTSGQRQNVFQQAPLAGTFDLALGLRFP